MSVPPDQFARLQGRVDRSGLAGRLVVVIGVGAVGSQVAKELANHAVGHLRVIDHGIFEIDNRPRHTLPIEYLGWNKAEGMTVYLADQVRGLQPEAVPRKIDDSVSDEQLDRWLADADLIIAATDDRHAQRRIGRRALAHDIPALFPGLYEGHGGEVFVQQSPRQPCFLCWDAWRPADQTVRGAAAGNADILEIIALTTQLSLGVLDRSADYLRRLLAPERGSQPPQLFVRNDHTLARRAVPKRPGCSACVVGPALGHVQSHSVSPRLTFPWTHSYQDDEGDSRPVIIDVLRGIGAVLGTIVGGAAALAGAGVLVGAAGYVIVVVIGWLFLEFLKILFGIK